MFIELGYEYSEDMPVFPGLPEDRIIPYSRMSSGGDSNITFFHHFLHNGTHVDAPYHFWDRGRSIDKIPIGDFVYTKPLLIEKNLKKGELLSVEELQSCGESIRQCDILLICTGYWKLRSDRDRYMDDFPAISGDSARFIRQDLPELKAVAIDTLSIENPILGPKTDFEVHKTLLSGEKYKDRTVLIYEDVNLGKVRGKSIKKIYAFPLRLRDLDASPVNMVAEV